MTTIVCDGFTIAADGMAMRGNIVSKLGVKKIRVRDNKIFALTGTIAAFEHLIDWYLKTGGDPNVDWPFKDKHETDFALIVIETNASGGIDFKWLCDDLPFWEPLNLPFAFGSGEDFAFGALDAGASAEDAVRIACRRTGTSREPIDVVSIVEALGLTTSKAQVMKEAAE